jgi:hypothetical protein
MTPEEAAEREERERRFAELLARRVEFDAKLRAEREAKAARREKRLLTRALRRFR